MVFTGLPIPIIASNFNLYYTYAKTKMIMVENTLREIRKKKQGNFQRTVDNSTIIITYCTTMPLLRTCSISGRSFCEFNSFSKSSPGNSSKVSPSSSIKSIDFPLVNQNTIKNHNAYATEVTRDLTEIKEGEEHTTDNVWTHMRSVATSKELK